MIARLIGIARRGSPRARMETLEEGVINAGGGLEGDHKGRKFPNRGITVLAREAWEAALAELGDGDHKVELPWITRRANLFVEGAELPRARGGLVRIGPVLLEVTYPTQPCQRMEEARAGLLKALHPDWRGGITARVLEGGTVRLGDAVEIVLSPPEKKVRLPG
jgi:MOSC domain-containing protein YiiM